MFYFYTPWKRQKIFGFLTFSVDIEMEHWKINGAFFLYIWVSVWVDIYILKLFRYKVLRLYHLTRGVQGVRVLGRYRIWNHLKAVSSFETFKRSLYVWFKPEMFSLKE